MQHRVLTSAIVWIPSGKLELIRREASHGVCGVHQDGMGIGPRFPFSFFLVFLFVFFFKLSWVFGVVHKYFSGCTWAQQLGLVVPQHVGS